MESPHPEWLTVGNGYKNGENRLTVTQLEDGWMVGVVAPDAIAPPHGPLLVTDDERTAYEIAKVLTWFASEQGFEGFLDDLRESSPGYSGTNWVARYPRPRRRRSARSRPTAPRAIQLGP